MTATLSFSSDSHEFWGMALWPLWICHWSHSTKKPNLVHNEILSTHNMICLFIPYSDMIKQYCFY